MQQTKRWQLLHIFAREDSKLPLVNEIIVILLENRGIKTEKERQEFLSPKLSDVTIESVEIDKLQLAKTIQRIQLAIQENEKIIVYGDYDVDGITGTAVIWETLHCLTKQVLPFIPHRVDEGYGLSIKGIENLLRKVPDIKLIITVDNGIVANDAVAFAKENGIDVIITDHHTKGETLPQAYSIVHTTKLCGAAVGWMLTKEIKEVYKDTFARDATEHLDLVSLATVADLVPLTGKNRAILKNGLPYLQQTKRVGLKALFAESKIDPKKIGVYQIGHVIGPRINAMGRLESAMDSLRLLCTKDEKRAGLLANILGVTNRERQLLTQARSLHAKERVAKSALKNVLIISDETYEEGIIGLIAGRLVDEYYRPSIVISIGEKVSKASARSVAGFNIIEFIRTAQDYLINAGGHPMAAGFTIETKKIIHLQSALESLAAKQLTEEILTRILKIDCVLPLSMMNQKLYVALQKLSPFGIANPEPVFMSNDVIVEEAFVLGKEKNHLKLRVTSEERDILMEAIGFNMGEYMPELQKGKKIAIAYTLDENEWNGRKKLQLKIKDIRLDESL